MRSAHTLPVFSTAPRRSLAQGLAACGLGLWALLAVAPLSAQVFVPLGAQFQVNSYITSAQ